MGAIGGGIAGIAATIIGGEKSQEQMDKANAALANALAEIQATNPANPQAVILQHFQQVGLDTPNLEQNINTAFTQLQQNPEQQQALKAQMGALEQMQQTAKGGLNPEDRAALNDIQTQAAGQANRAQQSIIQNAQQRGQAGGGAELAAQLQAAQGGANAAQQGGLQIGAQASQRALQAAAQSGQLGGQIEGQQYGQSAQQQAAQQAINNFNTQNQLGVQRQNVAAQNQAQLVNLQNAQMAANANTQASNQEAQRYQQAREQQFQNQLSKAQAGAGVYGAQAGQYNARAKQIGQEYANIGKGIGQVSSAGEDTAMGMMGGGGGSGGGSGAAMSGMWQGGEVSNYSNGGMTGDQNDPTQDMQDPSQVQKPFSVLVKESGKPIVRETSSLANQGYAPQKMSDGGVYDPKLEGNIIQGSDLDVSPVIEEKKSGGGGGGGGIMKMLPMLAMLASEGGKVPGKAKVKGDSPKNDTINAKLSPGEIVIPRSIAHDPKQAAKFIEEQNKKDLHGRLTALEKLCYGGMNKE